MKIYNPSGFSSKLTGSFSGSFVGDGSNITSISSDNVNFNFTAISSSAQIADDISGSFTSTSQSLASRIASQESFSSSLDNTFATDADLNLVSSSVDSLNAATSSYLQNTSDTLTGNLTVTGTITAQDLLVQEVTSSIVFSSGSNKFGSLISDTQSFTGSLQVSGSVELEDNVRIKVGSSDDLQIYHDSSNSYINETGNGSLITQASDYFLRVGGTNNTNNALTVANSGQVTLFYANNTKLNTTSTGVTVTGDITANALYDKDDSSYYLNLSDSGASLVTSGSIGIGTTSPSSLLHLYKSSGDTMINIQAVSAGDPGITFTSANNRTGNIFYSDGSTNAKLTYDHNDVSFKLYAHNTSTEDFVLNETTAYFPTQNVGIGTDSPNALLHLRSATPYIYLDDTSTTGTKTRFQLTVGDVGSTQTATLSFNNTSGTSLLDVMAINESGAVGIGETQPDSKLHVKGDMVTIEDPSGGFKMELSADADPVTIMSDNLTGAAYGQIAFLAGNGSGANDLTRMLINSNGNVGIGSTTPSSTLDIQTNGSAGIARISADGNGAVYSANGDVQLYTNNAAYSTSIYSANKAGLLFRVQNDGNVGIGTTSPQAKLDVDGNNYLDATTTKVFISDHGNNYDNGDEAARIQFRSRYWSGDNNLGATNSSIIHYKGQSNGYGGSDLGFTTSAIDGVQYERLRIFSSGNVGIGTNSAGSRLSILGGNSGNTPLIDLKATGTGTYQRGVRLLNAGMNAGDHIMYAVGQADGARNMGQVYFYYAGAGSTSNRISMGLHSVDDVFNILGDGSIGIGTTSPEQKLHVEGRGIFDAGTSSDIIQFRNDSGGFIIGNTTNLASIDLSSGQAIRIRQGSSVPFTLTTGGDLTLANNLYLINTKTRISSDANGEVGINYSVSNTSTYSLSVYEGSTRKFGVRKDGNLYIYPGATYSQQYTYTSSWASSFQTVVPNGTLGGNKTYLIQVWTNSFGTPPYYASAGWIFNTSAGTNGAGQSNTIDVATATHVSSNAYWQYNITTASSSTNGIAVKLVNGPSVSSIALFVRVTELSSF